MRTLFLLIILLFTGSISFAHCVGPVDQMKTIEEGSSLTYSNLTNVQNLVSNVERTRLRHPKKNNAVGIYRFKHTKVKRALAFRAKKDKPLLA